MPIIAAIGAVAGTAGLPLCSRPALPRAVEAGGRKVHRERTQRDMQQMFIILYKYKVEGEKKPGPVRQFRIYANDLEEAKREAKRYANYPNIEIIDVRPV